MTAKKKGRKVKLARNSTLLEANRMERFGPNILNEASAHMEEIM